MPTSPRFTAAEGATIEAAEIVEIEGEYQASITIRLREGNEDRDQKETSEIFQTLDDAREWINERASDRGFQNPKITIKWQ